MGELQAGKAEFQLQSERWIMGAGLEQGELWRAGEAQTGVRHGFPGLCSY